MINKHLKSLLFIGLILLPSLSAQAYRLGIRENHYQDLLQKKNHAVLIYYPTKENRPSKTFVHPQNALTLDAIPKATPATGNFPLLIIADSMHTAQLSYLAASLAEMGVIVVDVLPAEQDNPTLPSEGASAEDLSFLLNALSHDRRLGHYLDKNNIGILGFQFGGYSALKLAGARLDQEKKALFCHLESEESKLCRQWRSEEMPLPVIEDSEASTPLIQVEDNRFKYVIAINPDFADDTKGDTFYDPESLAAISVPILLLSSPKSTPSTSDNSDLKRISKLINPRQLTYVRIPEITYPYPLASECVQGEEEGLSERADAERCENADDDAGNQIHQDVLNIIGRFLYEQGLKLEHNEPF